MPAAIVLLLSTAIVGGGFAIRPASPAGCSIAADERDPEPQPREESPDELTEDEESESSKPAALGSAVVVDRPAQHAGTLHDCPTTLAPGACLHTAPIRGPPSQA